MRELPSRSNSSSCINPQQFRLQFEWNIANFIEQQSSFVRQFKSPEIGFDISAVNDASENFDWQKGRGGNGLMSMRRRAEELGGEFTVDCAKSKGTIITLRVPLGENSKISS